MLTPMTLPTALKSSNALSAVVVNPTPNGHENDDGRMPEREEQADGDRTLALLHEFARRIVDGLVDMVGVNGVVEGRMHRRAWPCQAGAVVVQSHQGPGPGQHIGDNKAGEKQYQTAADRPRRREGEKDFACRPRILSAICRVSQASPEASRFRFPLGSFATGGPGSGCTRLLRVSFLKRPFVILVKGRCDGKQASKIAPRLFTYWTYGNVRNYKSRNKKTLLN